MTTKVTITKNETIIAEIELPDNSATRDSLIAASVAMPNLMVDREAGRAVIRAVDGTEPTKKEIEVDDNLDKLSKLFEKASQYKG